MTIVDPDTTWIDSDVTIGARHHGPARHPAARRDDDRRRRAVIGPDTTLTDTEVGDGRRGRAHARRCLAVIGAGATVGPFSYLRPGTELGAKGKIGGFVETKNAKIGDGAKVPHLTYAGDATIGEGANIGAGTIFANYDGVAKHHSTRRAGTASSGRDTVLVAPVDVADGAYVGPAPRSPATSSPARSPWPADASATSTAGSRAPAPAPRPPRPPRRAQAAAATRRRDRRGDPAAYRGPRPKGRPPA